MSTNKKAQPTPAIWPHKKEYKVTQIIEAMEKQQLELATQPFRPDDLLVLFVDPAVHDVLKQAWKLVEPSGSSQELWTICDKPAKTMGAGGSAVAHLKFSWHYFQNADAFYVPKRAGAEKTTAVRFREDAPRHLVERFMQVATDYIDITWRFSLVLQTFKALNDPKVCTTLAQMRYVWPCIYTLMAKAGYPEEAALVEEASARAGDTVRVPFAMVPDLKPTHDTIMRALLLEDMIVQPPSPLDIKYELDHDFKRK